MKCLTGGYVFARVRLDRGGFVPGESILVYALVENDSSTTLLKTRASVTETIQYTVKGKIVAQESRELAWVERGKIGPRAADEWRNELLPIPPLPPTNLRGCHLIRIHYDVNFSIYPKSGKEITLILPILMATYPIRNADGTLKRRKGTYYPSTLPTFRFDDKMAAMTLNHNNNNNNTMRSMKNKNNTLKY